jgi:hypothetical protein
MDTETAGCCVVCLSEQSAAPRVSCPNCVATYAHESCLRPWLEKNGTCPTCRKVLVHVAATPDPRTFGLQRMFSAWPFILATLNSVLAFTMFCVVAESESVSASCAHFVPSPALLPPTWDQAPPRDLRLMQLGQTLLAAELFAIGFILWRYKDPGSSVIPFGFPEPAAREEPEPAAREEPEPAAREEPEPAAHRVITHRVQHILLDFEFLCVCLCAVAWAWTGLPVLLADMGSRCGALQSAIPGFSSSGAQWVALTVSGRRTSVAAHYLVLTCMTMFAFSLSAMLCRSRFWRLTFLCLSLIFVCATSAMNRTQDTLAILLLITIFSCGMQATGVLLGGHYHIGVL